MKTYACPTCKQVARREGNKLFPFCSERCHLVDLGRWLGEDYRIAGETDLEALEAIEGADGPSDAAFPSSATAQKKA